MSSINEAGGYRPIPNFTPVETETTSGNVKSGEKSEETKALNAAIAQMTAEKAILTPGSTITPEQKQETQDYFIKNEGRLAQSLSGMGAMATNVKFASQPFPAANKDPTDVTMAVIGDVMTTGLGVLQAIVDPKPSDNIPDANQYAQAENALNEGVKGAKALATTLANPQEAKVVGEVLDGVGGIIGNSLSIASTASNGKDARSIAGGIMGALAGIAKSISGVVKATAGPEVASRILETVSKGLDIASDGVKPGADPFNTASRAASVAFEEAGNIARSVNSETSAKVAAALPHAEAITQEALGLAAEGVRGTMTADSAMGRVGGIIDGTMGLVTATASPQVSSAVSELMGPVILVADPRVLMSVDMQGALSDARKDASEMEAKMKRIQGDASQAQQKAEKDAAIIAAVGTGVTAGVGAGMSVAGAASGIHANKQSNTAINSNQAKLAPLQEKEVALKADLRSATREMPQEQFNAKKAELVGVKKDMQQFESQHKMELGDIAAAKRHKAGDVALQSGSAVAPLGAGVMDATLGSDARIDKMKQEQMQKAADEIAENAKKVKAQYDEMINVFREVMNKGTDSVISIYQSARV